jgi:hypothetical protein
VKVGGTAFIEKNDPKALELFRAKVLRNVSSFFGDTKDIKLCVYESMSDYANNADLKGWIAADEIQELRVLQEEISKLREENKTLTDKLTELQANTTPRAATTPNAAQDKELLNVLQAIEIKIPADAAGGKEATNDLFSIAYSNRDALISGVTNAVNSSPVESFFYFNIIPKLQAHGLAENEKVPGVRYRRGFLNKKGQAFCASVEKKILLAKSEASAANQMDAAVPKSQDAIEAKEQSRPSPFSASGAESPKKKRARSKKNAH